MVGFGSNMNKFGQNLEFQQMLSIVFACTRVNGEKMFTSLRILIRNHINSCSLISQMNKIVVSVSHLHNHENTRINDASQDNFSTFFFLHLQTLIINNICISRRKKARLHSKVTSHFFCTTTVVHYTLSLTALKKDDFLEENLILP